MNAMLGTPLFKVQPRINNRTVKLGKSSAKNGSHFEADLGVKIPV